MNNLFLASFLPILFVKIAYGPKSSSVLSSLKKDRTPSKQYFYIRTQHTHILCVSITWNQPYQITLILTMFLSTVIFSILFHSIKKIVNCNQQLIEQNAFPGPLLDCNV